MCVGIKSCNTAVLSDCGRFPLYVETAKCCAKYWIRILKMPNHILVKQCCNIMKYFGELGNSNWCSRIKQLLQSTGFTYVWEMQDIQKSLLLFPHLFKDSKINIYRTSSQI